MGSTPGWETKISYASGLKKNKNRSNIVTNSIKTLKYFFKVNWQLWYIYTMEYYSAIKKNSFESILMRWMKLEPIIHSEVSQKDKDHYSILTHIYGL